MSDTKKQDAFRLFFLEGYAAGAEAMRGTLFKVLSETMTLDEINTVMGYANDVYDALMRAQHQGYR